MGNYAGFQSVKLNKPSRSSFDLTHDKRLTTRMGRLTPILVQEAVPSDSFRGSSEMLVRLAPLLAPIYDQIQVYVHFFFVPNRLLWADWEEFITGGRLGVGVDPVTAPIPPNIDIGDMLNAHPEHFAVSSLADYMGVPLFTSVEPVATDWNERFIDIMPFAAYQLIWYEYYRDRNFVADTVLGMPMDSGEIPMASAAPLLELQTRNYSHDYFTSALPFTQRGQEVLLPFVGEAAVTYLQPSRIMDATDNPVNSDLFLGHDSSTPAGALGTSNSPLAVPDTFNINQQVRIENIDTITMDGTTTINDFRAAYALQVWLERNAIGGSRYTESTQAHFGVKPQDSRLQRPEYIGGGRIPIKITEVLSTAWSNDGTADVPQANMAGRALTYGNTNQFNYFCTEHGFIVGILSIMNPPSYQQGLPRMFRRQSFLDYPWPTFAKLGEQEVADYEIYTTPASLLQDGAGQYPLFGYQSRYADWKYVCSSNHGEFRTTLLFWTLTRVFADPPTLGEEFNLFDDSTQDRIFAVSSDDNDNFWIYCHNKVSVKRPLPYFGTPNTLGFT